MNKHTHEKVNVTLSFSKLKFFFTFWVIYLNDKDFVFYQNNFLCFRLSFKTLNISYFSKSHSHCFWLCITLGFSWRSLECAKRFASQLVEWGDISLIRPLLYVNSYRKHCPIVSGTKPSLSDIWMAILLMTVPDIFETLRNGCDLGCYHQSQS